jgi:hypothetical protein
MIKPPWNSVPRNNNVKATPEMTRILVPGFWYQRLKKNKNYIRTGEKEDGERGSVEIFVI